MLRAEIASPRSSWPLIAATALVTSLWMMRAGLDLDWSSATPICAACFALEGLALFYRTKRREPRLSATLSGLSQVVVLSAVAAVFSYAVARTDSALWDARLDAFDHELGLDWRAYLAFMDGHPRLSFALTLAYRSLIAQLFLIIVVLGFGGRLRAMREFVAALCIAAVAAVSLSGLMPSVGTYAHFGLTTQDFPHIDPAAPFAHMAHLTGLRAGTLRGISLDHLEGIITFPSMHASMGVLFGFYFWNVRFARVPMAVVNALLVAATPIDGGHYFADVIAGLAIAVAAIAIASWMGRRAASAGAPSGAEAGGVASVARI